MRKMIITLTIVIAFTLILLTCKQASSEEKNIKTFATDFDTTWSACIQAIADLKFKIKSTDKSSGLIQVETEAAASDNLGDANEVIKTYTTKKVGSFSGWQAYTFDFNILLAKKDSNSTEVKINTSIEGYNGWSEKWEVLESNGTIEKEIFDTIQNKVNALIANKVISEKPAQTTSSAQTPSDEESKGIVNLTSQPDKADIELNGNFVGQTPSTLKLKEGKYEIKISKEGYKEWIKNIQILKDSNISLEAVLEKK